MSAQPPARGMRGAVVWDLTAFQPEAPFELVGQDGVSRSYSTAVEVARAVRSGELAQAPPFMVPAKLRPVVLLQDRPRGELPEYAALKTTRFTKLSAAEQQKVRNGDAPALFHLAKNKAKYGLGEENAIDLNSLVRVHTSAIVTTPVGYLDRNEMDVLGRRLARFLDIDLARDIQAGIDARWEAIVEAHRARSARSDEPSP